jgi:hypothetical protein
MKKILVVSDLQTGSRYSQWPDHLPIKDGGFWHSSPKQQIVKVAWDAFLLKVKEIKPDILVLNGDMIEGAQEKAKGIPVITTDLGEQVEAAIEILKPLRKMVKECFCIKGTSYHDNDQAGPLERIAKELDCTPFRAHQYTDWVLNLDVDGVILNFAHHISVSTGLYRATAPDREGIWSALAGRSKVPDADAVIRSHVHLFCHVEHSHKHIIITPGWQLQTEYQIKKSYYRMFPELGAVLIQVYPDLKKRGLDPIEIKKIICKLPREKTLKSAV